LRLLDVAGTLVLLAGCAGAGAPSPSAAPTPTPAPTLTPAPSLTPTPSVTPAVTPTPSPATWSSLAWTRTAKTFSFGLTDVVARGDGYVGIGRVWDADDQVSAAFFASDDGVTWRVAQRLSAGEELTPRLLLTTDAGLLAVINVIDESADGAFPHLWSSTDGRSWQELSSPSWQAAWSTGRRLLDVVSGPNGLVAVGSSSSGAVALFSADDGRNWQATTLPGTAVEARSVVVTSAGFLAVGAVGGKWNATMQEVLGGSRAAWTSPDGRSWQTSEIEPAADADGLTFTGVYAAADGLLALASETSGSVPGRRPQFWASENGRRWESLGVGGQVVPCGDLAADGVRMLILGDVCPTDWNDDTPFQGFRSGWTSLDGLTWTPVSFSGQLMDQQSWDHWWLTDTGLIFSGTNVIWRATAG
jgi:hypothetical protein